MGFRPGAPVILSTLCHGESAPERGYSPANHPAAQMLPRAASLDNLHLRGENGTHRQNRTDGRRKIPACAGAFFVDWPTTESLGNLCLRRGRPVVSTGPVRPQICQGEEGEGPDEKGQRCLLEQSNRTKILAEERSPSQRSPSQRSPSQRSPLLHRDGYVTRTATYKEGYVQRGLRHNPRRIHRTPDRWEGTGFDAFRPIEGRRDDETAGPETQGLYCPSRSQIPRTIPASARENNRRWSKRLFYIVDPHKVRTGPDEIPRGGSSGDGSPGDGSPGDGFL
jgi:hypothetical protein